MAKDINIPEHLIALQRRALKEHADLLDLDYSAEAWQPWRDAAGAFQAAVTEHVAANKGLSRVDLEMAVKKAAREQADQG